MFAKRFFYVSSAILCLAIAYHLGATSATAQATKSQVVAAYWSPRVQISSSQNPDGNVVVTATGDIYYSNSGYVVGWQKIGNVFAP